MVQLHHALGSDYLPPYFKLEEDVFHEDTNLYLTDFSIPSFLFEEEDVINDTPS